MSYDTEEINMIRSHPLSGGCDVKFEDQHFQGVSPDIFTTLDTTDQMTPYKVTHKLNITIGVNPSLYPIRQFFKELTNDKLETTEKCHFHGDEKTGLKAAPFLELMLKRYLGGKIVTVGSQWGFQLNGKNYFYYSIGIAAAKNYGPVSTREGNDAENNSSHFEIKFEYKESTTTSFPKFQYICLNVHLNAQITSDFGKDLVLKRLENGIRLFYHELALIKIPSAPKVYTLFNHSFKVSLDDVDNLSISENIRFHCKHKYSQVNLANYKKRKQYVTPQSFFYSDSLFPSSAMASSIPAINTAQVKTGISYSQMAKASVAPPPTASKATIPKLSSLGFNPSSKDDFPALGKK